ncbi:hypothetical protein LTR37_020893 [Vermiconidia calcicola]|uniref:Uncharacterized protein n=1 Tax=Vermiconidia calcicola TaxID=1690605 RepID=A0ACC3M9X7_9PEZI|nr:hypothetical protein LTR37_020893 [Vermiconidia calcicola]
MPDLPEAPVNREPDVADLVQSFLTREDGYERNHCMHPQQLDASTHQVEIDGAVNTSLRLSVEDLKNDFEQHTVVCALQCAGNRRHTMRTNLKEVSGIDWFDGAVMNCKWTGPRLRDVLQRAGISLGSSDQEQAHVAFACYATPCQEDMWYGASISLTRAMREDMEVILALKMNDQPLSIPRGSPVRVITPGIAGARAVKWLDKITVQMQECQNHYMQYDYKVLPEEAVDAEAAKKFWHKVPPVQEMPVNSVVAVPNNEATVQRDTDGTITVQGYALPYGDDGPITRVDVSGDGGTSWKEAELIHHEGDSKYSWKLWKAPIAMQAGSGQAVLSKATDSAGNTQPDEPKWNLRGVCYNGLCTSQPPPLVNMVSRVDQIRIVT